MGIQPAMWSDGQRAFWQQFPGSRYYEDFHPGIDEAAAIGTPILALESGICTTAYFDSIHGGGNIVGVTINDGVEYRHNHCSKRMVKKGDPVKRGQVIALVGDTGYIRSWSRTAETWVYQRSVTGPHNHQTLNITLMENYVTRTYLYNPTLFMEGGSLQDHPLVRPPSLPDTSIPTEVELHMSILSKLVRQTTKRVRVRANAPLYKGPGPKYGIHWRLPDEPQYFEVTHGLNDGTLAEPRNGSSQYWLLRRAAPNAKGAFFAHAHDVTFL